MSDARPPLQQLLASLRQGELHVVLGRYSEILLALLVITTIAIMIIPIPTFLLDILLSAQHGDVHRGADDLPLRARRALARRRSPRSCSSRRSSGSRWRSRRRGSSCCTPTPAT